MAPPYAGLPAPPDETAFVLVTTAPGDPRVRVLVEAMRAVGGTVFLAENEAAARAAQNAYACVVFLTPTTWNCPANTMAVALRPQRLIPVFAEPMALPPGPWSTAPIELRGTPDDGARAIVAAINAGASRPLPPGMHFGGSGPLPRGPGIAAPAGTAFPSSAALTPPLPTDDPASVADAQSEEGRQQDPPSPASGGGLSAPENRVKRAPLRDLSAEPPAMPLRQKAMVDGPALRRAEIARDREDESDHFPPPPRASRTIPSKQPHRTPYIIGGIVVVLVLLASALILPGQLGQRARQGNTNTTAYAAAVPGPTCDKQGALWEAAASADISITCSSAGLNMSQRGNFGTLHEVFYRGLSDTFPTHFRVAVTTTITGGDVATSVGLDIRRQLTSGGDLHLISAGGVWSIVSVADGIPSARLALGFLPQGSKTWQLAVEVNGSYLSFAVNGKTVGTVTDPQFSQTHAIALVLGNPDAKGPIAATFSQFQYTPLDDGAPPGTPPPPAWPYSAALPGPGCDTGKAIWAPLAAYAPPTTTVQCAMGGLVIAQAATSTAIGEARFFGYGQELPQNQTIEVAIDLTNSNGGCAGILTRTNANLGGYSFTLCQNGGWSIDKIASDGLRTMLANGRSLLKASTVLRATVNGSELTIGLDGATLQKISDPTYHTTKYLSLFVQTPAGVSGSATFRNFQFAALP